MDATCLGSPAASGIAHAKIRKPEQCQSLLVQRVGRFYDAVMASNNSGAVGADAILRQLDAEADSTSIEVTLYLPWGMATGITVPDTYFGHYVAHFFTKHDAGDIAGRLAALEAEQDRVFIHLRKARCYVAGQVVTHDSLRVRLSDVSAWTVAGVEEPQPANPSIR